MNAEEAALRRSTEPRQTTLGPRREQAHRPRSGVRRAGGSSAWLGAHSLGRAGKTLQPGNNSTGRYISETNCEATRASALGSFPL